MNREEFAQARIFICTDIRRELRLAQVSEQQSMKDLFTKAEIPLGGGNFLAALGLLCYTEFLGKITYECKKNGRDWSSENFNKAFDRFGPKYAELRSSGLNVYDVFRCGLAHEYYAKNNCTIYMLRHDQATALGRSSDGRLYFNVEHYFEDFMKAMDILGKEKFGCEPP